MNPTTQTAGQLTLDRGIAWSKFCPAPGMSARPEILLEPGQCRRRSAASPPLSCSSSRGRAQACASASTVVDAFADGEPARHRRERRFAPQQNCNTHVSVGSEAALSGLRPHVRSCPDFRHHAILRQPTLRARNDQSALQKRRRCNTTLLRRRVL